MKNNVKEWEQEEEKTLYIVKDETMIYMTPQINSN